MKLIKADIAIGYVEAPIIDEETGEETGDLEKHSIGVPCLIHDDVGIIWQGGPVPIGPFGLALAGGILKELNNTMRASKEWHDVWKAVDWSILGQVGGGNRAQRRQQGV